MCWLVMATFYLFIYNRINVVVVVRGGCEVIVHGIQTTFNVTLIG